MSGRLPDFLLIGAAKSGTTMLYNLLVQHPQVFVPDLKEPRFFLYEGEHISQEDKINNKTITHVKDYYHLFKDAGECKTGEASGYLISEKARDLIHSLLPEVKLIAILRNPIDRAFSHHTFSVMKGFEKETNFSEIIENNKKDINSDRNYLNHGLYSRHIKMYLDKFPSKNFLVLLYDDLIHDPLSCIKQVYDHIGVSAEFTPSLNVKRNVSGKVKSKLVNNLYQKDFRFRNELKKLLPEKLKSWFIRLIERNNYKRASLSSRDKAKLIEFYHEDVKALEKILKKDLSHWLQK